MRRNEETQVEEHTLSVIRRASFEDLMCNVVTTVNDLALGI